MLAKWVTDAKRCHCHHLLHSIHRFFFPLSAPPYRRLLPSSRGHNLISEAFEGLSLGGGYGHQRPNIPHLIHSRLNNCKIVTFHHIFSAPLPTCELSSCRLRAQRHSAAAAERVTRGKGSKQQGPLALIALEIKVK